MPRRPYLTCLFVAALGLTSTVVSAQTPRPGPPGLAAPDALSRERSLLAAELERVNTEIDALKRERRGLRDDYRLRGRMADAESLARRLTELDGRLGTRGRPASDSADVPWSAAPEIRPFDDRPALEAKADILSDQARRLTLQADGLEARLKGMRGRQELRRRASQLERDPFSPLEQAKRRIVTSSAGPSAPASNSGGAKDLATGNPVSGRGAEGVGSASTPPSGPAISQPPAGSQVPGGTVTGAATGATGPITPTTGAPGPAVAVAGDQAGSKSAAAGAAQTPFASPLGGVPGTDSLGSVAAQFRGILDETTLAEIRRLEIPGSPTGSVAAMERALAALRARAIHLSTGAATLRRQAKAAP